ncbi:allantoate amidohydrolase [Streptomyces sp. DSM 44917]|uniref:Allantoate amidohydrolase n=1 Tax=Streptomyces boetiae TaxID=3075541 RepID=A0ABU2LCT9_9ACTN|nr:allantoate amidohydrolase [Streptomyces sp. DSM 44917]MDT0309396.1 allantoate amidohydrolase [Streptomyces sp. DSM 44917]
MWAAIEPVGRAASGGYRRFAWTEEDRALREWFRAEAAARGLACESDRNGNLWALTGDGPGAVVAGSHLDSVPDGGAYDGPLGVVSAFAALDALRARGARPLRPLGVAAFAEEEGARFGVACAGSRLACGLLDPGAARALRDAEGVTLERALAAAGHDPQALGPDPERLARLGAFVELHIEQGRALDGTGHAVGLGSGILPHGRWRLDFRGAADHAGTTRLEDRRDPMLTHAHTVLAARKRARQAGALATVGKVAVHPGGVNAVPGRVTAWLDARAPDEPTLAALVEGIARSAAERGERDGVAVTVTRESHTPGVAFDPALRARLAAVLGGPPELPTGAGHDAGILASAVPTAMLYVRNPTGVSHAPAERVEEGDCLAGVAALADVLEELACR